MLVKVKKIGENPLQAVEIEEADALAKSLVEREISKGPENKKNEQKKKEKKEREHQQTYETAILEQTIIKIGTLLALGFGEAGSAIIAKNMEQS